MLEYPILSVFERLFSARILGFFVGSILSPYPNFVILVNAKGLMLIVIAFISKLVKPAISGELTKWDGTSGLWF